MNISMMDYLNWNPNMDAVPGLKHGYSSTNGITFRWIGWDCKEHYSSVDSIEKAKGFVIGFTCGILGDR